MTDTVWLASYPKSGNTWFRILIANLSARDDQPIDINALPESGRMASARGPFDDILLIESGLLTHDEADCLRPRLYEELARSAGYGEVDALENIPSVRFAKVHDAYTLTPKGEPLLAGERGAKGAIVIVRDPRDVALSLANHMRSTVDEAIVMMNNPDAGFCMTRKAQANQLRQKLLGWSDYVESWLSQRDIPVHLVRYEDLKNATAEFFQSAMAFAGHDISLEEAQKSVDLADFSNLQSQERANGFREWVDRGNRRLFFRRGETGGWRDELTSDQVRRIELVHAPMMARLGYELSTSADMARAG